MASAKARAASNVCARRAVLCCLISYEGDRPLSAEETADPYRRGMLLMARGISHAERAWLHQVLDGGEGA
ncbi:hypothetical protein ACF065_22725 [Streptomyces sp. NPDC015232]|uniref:hypothetical protein n=1 Tax=unclassified Streptomyces TaxID=2593676 RepID=UPI0036F8D2A5